MFTGDTFKYNVTMDSEIGHRKKPSSHFIN